MADPVVMLEELKRAYYSGATSLSYDGRSVTYRSASEMREAIAALEAQIGTTRPREILIRSQSKGW